MVTRLSCYLLKVTNYFRMPREILDNEYAVYQHHEKELKYTFFNVIWRSLDSARTWGAEFITYSGNFFISVGSYLW